MSGSAAVLMTWAAPAVAQTAPVEGQATATAPERPDMPRTAPVTTAGPTPGVADIIVTANKRSERALEVPGAITAFRGDDLLKSGTDSIKDLVGLTPGLQFNNGVGTGAPIIRGLSIGIDTSPTVATVVNGAPIGSSSSLSFGAQETLDLDPIDIDRVEVLKGPQGTVYGANTLGGLISYTLRQPSLTQSEGIVRAEVDGTEDGDISYSGRGAFSTPLIQDQLGFRASGFYQRNGGFIDNQTRGIKNENSSDSYGAHGTLLFEPTDKLRIVVDGIYQHLNINALDVVVNNFDTRRQEVGDLHYNQFVIPRETKTTAVGIVHIGYDFGFANLTSVTSIQAIHSIDDQNVSEATLTGTLQQISALAPTLGPVLGFTAPTIPPPGAFDEQRDNLVHKVSQEIRLTSPDNQRFTWIVGAFYTHETTRYGVSEIGQDASGNAIAALDPTLRFYVPSTLEEYSGFANATYRIVPKLDFTAGIRLGEIKQTSSQGFSGSYATALNTILAVGGATSIPAQTSESRSSDFVQTYLATLRYHFSPDGIIYARFATGFRPGGPNIITPGLPATFNPDHTQNYELGIKSKFWGGRGTIDVTGYYERWNNIIVVDTSGGLAGYTNGGNARIYGVESAVSIRPVPRLTLSATFTYSKANIISADPRFRSTLADGDPLPYDPKFSGSVSAEYRRPLSETVTGYLSATGRFDGARDSVFRSGTDTPNYKLRPYGLLDLQAGADLQKISIDLFLKNVTNKRAQLAANPFGNIAEVTIQRPRTVGLAVTLKY